MKTGKKGLALVLAMVLVLGGVAVPPVTASAANIEIQNGLPEITVGTSGNSNPTVIGFGEHEWVVIGDKDNGVKTDNAVIITLLLKKDDAGGGYGTTQFHGSSNHYSGSTLQDKMDEAYDSLLDGEKELVVERALEGGSANYSYEGYEDNKVAGDAVSRAHFWPLSVSEANKVNYSAWMFGGDWWLRSPGFFDDTAAVVSVDGFVPANGSGVNNTRAVRPAFHLNLASVLFVSAAEGGKSSATVGSLSEATPPTGAVKLTVLDSDPSSLNLTVINTSEITATPGGIVNIPYTGAVTGTDKYVSAVMTDGDTDGVLYYGKLDSGNANGTARFAVPDDLAVGSYTLKLFNEECNGDYETDFASEPVEIDLTVEENDGQSDWVGKTVYFGKNTLIATSGPNGNGSPIPWRVMAEDNGVLTLLSSDSLGKRLYDNSGHNNWSDSDIVNYLNGTSNHANNGFLQSAFAAAEQASIGNYGTTETGDYVVAIDINQKIVLPSVKEVKNGSTWGWTLPSELIINGDWWLRSPGSVESIAAYFGGEGIVYAGGSNVGIDRAIRPAFRLDLSSALFATAAVGGKSATVGSLAAVEQPSGVVKFTLRDGDTDNLNLSVSDTSAITAAPGEQVGIEYDDAVTGPNKYVSAILTSSTDEVLHYGKLVDLTGGNGGSGTARFTVPSILANGSYKIKLFNEECNADNYTDFASALVKIDLRVQGKNSSSSSNSDSNSSTTIIVTIPPVIQPDWPAVGSVTVKVEETTAQRTFTITDSLIKSALDKAQSSAKAQNRTANGVGARLVLEGAPAEGLTLTLEHAALNRLITTGAKRFEITGAPLSLGFDVQALSQLQKQGTGNVTISTQPATAKGVRNAYDITLSTVKDGKTVNITNLGTGTAILSIPTTPAKNEAAGSLYAVYVDDKGKTRRIEDSFYDANSGSVVFNTNHFSIYGVAYAAPAVKALDTAAHWAKESIDYVLGRGLLSSNAQGKFTPNTAITRGELVTALGKLMGINTKAYTKTSFTDVKADSEALPYIAWASSKGILQGINGKTFAPDKAVTRQEIALILQNYAKATGDTLPVTRTAVTFADASSIGNTYKASVKALQQAGIVMGEQNNKFNPTANITRAEVSATLHRYIKLSIDPATAQGWAKNDDGQFQYYKDGKAVTGTQTIDGVKYVFSPNGTLKTGWVQEGSKWRYYSGNTMVTGWRNISTNGVTKRYYFDANGNRVSGKWLEIGGAKYYFEADGALNPDKK